MKQPKSTARATPKEATAEKTTASNHAVAEKVVIKDEIATAGEIPQVGANEVLTADKDLAVIGASGVKVGELAKDPIADTKEARDAVKAQEEVVEKLQKGEATVSGSKSAYEAAIATRPLVPHPVSGKPVAETADQTYITQSIAGELVTEEAPAKKK